MISGRWSHYEHQKWVRLIKQYGKDYKRIAEELASKNIQQVGTRVVTTLTKLKKDMDSNRAIDEELWTLLKTPKYRSKEYKESKKPTVKFSETKAEDAEEIEEASNTYDGSEENDLV